MAEIERRRKLITNIKDKRVFAVISGELDKIPSNKLLLGHLLFRKDGRDALDIYKLPWYRRLYYKISPNFYGYYATSIYGWSGSPEGLRPSLCDTKFLAAYLDLVDKLEEENYDG